MLASVCARVRAYARVCVSARVQTVGEMKLFPSFVLRVYLPTFSLPVPMCMGVHRRVVQSEMRNTRLKRWSPLLQRGTLSYPVTY